MVDRADFHLQPPSGNNRFAETADALRQAFAKNPYLRVYIGSGYYDLATPYFATDYTVRHLGLDPSLRGNVSVSYYEAGHMMYIHKPSLVRLKSELAAFLRRSSGGRGGAGGAA